MRILFDHQIFTSQQYGGISRYHYELLKFLPQYEVEALLPVVFSNNHYLRHKDVSAHCPFFPGMNLKMRNQIMWKVNQWATEKQLKKQAFDVFHPTYYQSYFLDPSFLQKKPFVLTVHDMTIEKYMPTDTIIPIRKVLMEKADKIIAISEKTKEDILAYTNIDAGKIKRIYHGNAIDPEKIKPAPPTFSLEKPYLLYVGARWEYKNFDRFIKVFSRLSVIYPELRVICTGSTFSAEEKQRLQSLKIEEKVLAVTVNDNELAWLYRHAQAFVFPSVYEGFGFPILEAFAMDCPVVLSQASCFPEIAGEAAIYFEPTAEDSMYQAIEKVLTDSALRDNLRQKGKEQLKRYAWEETARETADLYKSIR
ncbi:glycosyltransferase family 1 protein [Parabacteroides sp. 52]|uniref:glycosyltransferase family 4 protein n=1 Tax=unclassified Parabacteroides TaxID=2649774 RepID=UPI0013D66144|nr:MULTISPECIES: glycosyltransferase family 1 protein [unclassified Parabacteroides]MDH6534233.1 glycosyltransferase involved in cell wall biosynthesis [Parabacteroides sp. PM5-20]NDV55383.1 glycosyltransferase family 1 protein [Parabacteroides sp. 52]